MNRREKQQFLFLLIFLMGTLFSVTCAYAAATPIPAMVAVNATLTLDSSGSATVAIDLSARKVSSNNIFHVDETSIDGDGSAANPYTDLPEVFAHIANMGYSNAVINVAAGDYSWGHATDPDGDATAQAFNAGLTVIGQGPSLTRVIQGPNDEAAAIFNEPGYQHPGQFVPGKSLYIEGVAFVGAGSAGSAQNTQTFDARNGTQLTLVNSVFSDAHHGDGAKILFWESVVVHNSKALDNFEDGFSYSHLGTHTTLPMYVVEVDVEAIGNGVNGAASSQGSTTHRHTEIARIGGLYSSNPTNIEDTGRASWNIDLVVENSTVYQGHEGGYVNLRARGDKLEGNPQGSGVDSNVWLISGNYNTGGVVHAHSTSSTSGNPIQGFIHYSSLFDIASHLPIMTADAGAGIIHPADDTYVPNGVSNPTLDSLREDALHVAIEALESYGASNGTYRVSGGGSNGNGLGFFHFTGGAYPDSIANVLVNDGHLASPAPLDPLHSDPGIYSQYDFMVYRCQDRVAVFSRADAIQPSTDDATWWTDNSCTQVPISKYDRSFFVLSEPVGQVTGADAEREVALDEIIAALESFGSTNGTYKVSGGGSLGNGLGFFHYVGGNYPDSVANVLVAQGHLDSPAPLDPLHATPGSYSPYDFMIYRCLDRVAMFSRADDIEPDPADAAWWSTNSCTQVPVIKYDRTYFVISEPLP